MIVVLLIASLVVPYSRPFHLTSPHPEWNTPCGADLLLPYIRLSSVLPFLLSLPCVRVSHLSLYTASFLTAIVMRYYHVPIAHMSKAWLSLSGQRGTDVLLRPIILVVLLSFRLSFDVFYFFSLSIEFCECSPCVHREHRFLFGDVTSSKCTDLCIHGSP